MPTKRKPITRAPASIPAGLWAWLTDQPIDPDHNEGILQVYRCEPAELWRAHRSRVLAWWIGKHPGTRPELWWRFDAPGERRRSESEAAFLRRHRLLAPGEGGE